MQQRTQINPQIFQELLESASNAAAKGQAQYFTPAAWASVLGLPLPKSRRTVVDLTAGNGQLMAGVSSGHTWRLGCDIDPAAARSGCVVADLTKFHNLLREIQFEADLFVLNPPWDLHWHRDRLKALADSACPAVAEAFAARDGRLGADTIDSTIATLCLALDFCSAYGEGFLIANEATLQRLIFAMGAPHRALENHIWAHLAINGNLCQAKADPKSDFKTGVIWFARPEQSGTPKHYAAASREEAAAVCKELQRNRLRLRRGCETSGDYNYTEDTVQMWRAAAEEWGRLTGQRKAPQWNIMLSTAGTIITDLSLFEQHSDRIEKGEVARLFALNGKSPMNLVIQKAHRKELEHAAFGGLWRVAPAVQEAVRMAIKEYDAVRAPIRPLNEIQRLGFLDEQDTILCTKPLAGFTAGTRYELYTTTVSVNRSGSKMNVCGELDAVEWSGSELCIYLRDAGGTARCFMEARLRNDKVRVLLPVENRKPPEKGKLTDDEEHRIHIDFTLQDLVEHFQIPEVPSVAELHPDLYQRNLAALHEIEALVA